MTNLVEIQSQIEKLQKQAAQIKEKELDTTIQDILAKMLAFGISIKDLQTASRGSGGKGKRGRMASNAAKAATPKAKRKNKLAGSTVAPKFRGPNGETWSGRGLMPKWLSNLVASGRTKEEFAI
jgi:DNA-binding protein H-NS